MNLIKIRDNTDTLSIKSQEIQKIFIDIFETEDERKVKILIQDTVINFVDRFNSFLSNNDEISKDKKTKNSIMEKEEIMKNKVWKILESKLFF